MRRREGEEEVLRRVIRQCERDGGRASWSRTHVRWREGGKDGERDAERDDKKAERGQARRVDADLRPGSPMGRMQRLPLSLWLGIQESLAESDRLGKQVRRREKLFGSESRTTGQRVRASVAQGSWDAPDQSELAH